MSDHDAQKLLEGEAGVRDYRLERLIMLSDGVFAIAMTLLALEIRPPDHWDHTALGLWRAEWRSFAAFAVSFAVVARFWLDHRRLFGALRQADGVLTTLNFLVLGLATLAPFATRLVYETGMAGGPQPLGLYMGHFGLLGLATAGSWIYANLVRPQLLREPPPARSLAYAAGILLFPLLACVLGALILVGLDLRNAGWVLAAAVASLLARRWLVRDRPAPAKPAPVSSDGP